MSKPPLIRLQFKDTDARAPRPGPPQPPETPWWRVCELTEFERRVREMPDAEFEELGARLRAAAKAFATQLQGAARDDESRAWRRRARMAFSFMVEKKNMIHNEEHRRHQAKNKVSQVERMQRRLQLLIAAEESVEAGDTAEAIRWLIRFLSPKSPENAP